MPSPSMLYIAGGGVATVALQSTAVQLSTTSAPCTMVVIQGVSTNTSLLVVANSTAKLLATGRVGLPVYWGSTSQPVTVYATDVSQLYIDGISTEKVSYVYYKYGMAS
jgi:hypothetical protein